MAFPFELVIMPIPFDTRKHKQSPIYILLFFFTSLGGPRQYVSIPSYNILSQWWAEEKATASYSFQSAVQSGRTMDAGYHVLYC